MDLKPEGTYLGSIVEIGTDESQQGTPFLFIEVQVNDIADDQGAWVECDKALRSINFYLSEKAWPHSREKLEKLGFNGDFNTPNIDDKYWTEGVVLDCWHEEYEGKTREKWNFQELRFERERKIVDANTLKALSAKFKSGGKPKATPAPGKPAPPANNNGSNPPSAGAAPAAPAPQQQSAGASATMQAPADAEIPF